MNINLQSIILLIMCSMSDVQLTAQADSTIIVFTDDTTFFKPRNMINGHEFQLKDSLIDGNYLVFESKGEMSLKNKQPLIKASYIEGKRQGLYQYREFTEYRRGKHVWTCIDINYRDGQKDGQELRYLVTKRKRALFESIIMQESRTFKMGVLHGFSVSFVFGAPSVIYYYQDGKEIYTEGYRYTQTIKLKDD